jgi:hypothetical protein
MIEITRDAHEGAVLYDNVRDTPLVLSADEKEEYMRRASELWKQLNDTKIVAKYKLELIFGKMRSNRGHNITPGILSFWHSGSKFHGGGDEKLYLCPGAHLKKSECNALLQESYNVTEGIVCPACGTIWKHEQTIGELMFNLPMRKWAEVLYRYYRLCDYNCDIYLKHAPSDIRSVSLAQVERATWKGSQQLENARVKRGRMIYPLRNIISDANAGADLLGRFYAFLTA